MTFSIVACDPKTGSWGVGVASKYLAVGSMVPAARADAGALVTQAYTNASFRPLGLSALRDGRSAGETLDALLSQDPGRAARQVGIVDGRGRSAVWTGSDCSPYAGGIRGDGYAVLGNLLTGPEVLAAMADTWSAGALERPLAHRLLGALQAGETAGGDRRGRQSAAILVARRGSNYILGTDIESDLRVDDHDFPLTELGRLLDLRYEAPP